MKSDKQSVISSIAAAKDRDAWALRQQGLTYAAIGLRMGVSKERVRQRIAKHERKLKRLQEKQSGNH
jgi:DNA-directed RNA polymerase sigma subunit (sigma70/sigma32)